MHQDELDALLRESSPIDPLTSEERHAVALMITDSAPQTKFRRVGRPVAVGAIVAALVGVGGVAAAAMTGFWAPWAQEDPLAVLHYELPSGVTCEMRIGNAQDASEEVANVIRESLAGVSFDDTKIIETASEREITDSLVDDNSYQLAYNWTVVAYIDEAIKLHGLHESEPQYSAQANCG